MKQILLAPLFLLAACSGAETVADAAEPKPEPQAQAAAAPAKPNITSQDLGGCLLYTSPSPRD